jgi:hypothetical protein
VAGNETVFRDANERIAESARSLSITGQAPFLCECADERCRQVIPLGLEEYEVARAHPGRFVTLPGHEIGSAEVVEQNERFALIDKLGPFDELRP